MTFHLDEAMLIVVAYYIYNAFVQALPFVEDVKNPWAKFAIRFAHGLAGNFGILLWGQPKKSVVRQLVQAVERRRLNGKLQEKDEDNST